MQMVSFDLQPVLEGERLRLGPLSPEDFSDLYAVASDPLIWEQHPASDPYEVRRQGPGKSRLPNHRFGLRCGYFDTILGGRIAYDSRKGMPVSEERILVVVPRLYLDGTTRTVGDLVFTTRQVFLAKRTGRADPARVPGVAGTAPAAPRRKSAAQRIQPRPLDSILATADPRTRFDYRELESITVKVGGLFSSPTVRFIPHHGRRLKLSGKQSALELLASAIPVLAGAGAPISLA